MTASSSPLVNRTLDVLYLTKKKRTHFIWSLINGSLFLVLAYDLSCFRCPDQLTIYEYFEYVMATVFILNFLYNILSYIYLVFTMTPVEVNQAQKKLLGFKDSDSSFRLSRPKKPLTQNTEHESLEDLNISCCSWLNNSSPGHTPTKSGLPGTWPYRRSSPGSPSGAFANVKDDFISDQYGLQEYMKRFEEKEQSSCVNTSNDSTMERVTNRLDTPQRTLYQLAQLDTSGTKGTNDDNSLTSSPVWFKLHVDPQHLTQWNWNLRLWISKTILERLVKEINHVDDSLQKAGMSDVKIGLVGVDRLRRTASVAQHIPTLPVLVTFLEISNNQEYVVQRIKELANGACMSEYKWNKGGRYQDKEWHEGLPTDAALVMHLLSRYLDTQLMAVSQSPEGSAFSSRHYITYQNKTRPTSDDTLAIHQTSINPPHFVLLNGHETIELDKGRNNLFHTILLFLQLVVVKHHGMLGRINLGRSGLNLLWVIDR